LNDASHLEPMSLTVQTLNLYKLGAVLLMAVPPEEREQVLSVNTAHGQGAMPAPEPRWPIGLVPNAKHQPADSVFDFADYTLAIVEFDDQGRCYDRGQMEALARKLAELSVSDAVILVFVHGWKHDGRSDDDNLTRFLEVAEQIATEEKATPTPVPVLAIFVAWRGLSLYGFGVENLTFWGRKQAGLLVAMGAPRELFGRVRRFRDARLQAGGAPLVVMVGHSFGGMIVYAALAQSLIEAAAMDSNVLVPSIADLVLLVNPAFEAARYLPIHDVVKERGEGGFARNQRPVFVSVTAHNGALGVIPYAAASEPTRLPSSAIKACCAKGIKPGIRLGDHLGSLTGKRPKFGITAHRVPICPDAIRGREPVEVEAGRLARHSPAAP
jgi:hypothetical protein